MGPPRKPGRPPNPGGPWRIAGSSGPPRPPRPTNRRRDDPERSDDDDPEVLARRADRAPMDFDPAVDFKSRPTVYRGIQMRSRAEARWAVVFDFLGLEWEYEPEYYDIGSVNYLPDFWILGLECWVEVKGAHPTEMEQAKARGLARLNRHPVYIFCCTIPIIGPDGAPGGFPCGEDLWKHGYRYNPDGTEEMGYMIGVKECCGTLGVVQDAQTQKIICDCDQTTAEWDEQYLAKLQVGFMRGRKARWD
jgi:hypothetical protein